MPEPPEKSSTWSGMSFEQLTMRLMNTRRAEDITRWTPPTDVVETEKAIVIRVELAGVDRGSLEVHQDGDSVVITGVRPEPALSDAVVKYHQVEVDYGEFVRVIRLVGLPAHADIRAHYSEGFLLVHIPREAFIRESARREIPVD